MSSDVKVPEHSPAPTPIRAVYGFVFYLLGVLALALYFVWAVVPDSVLHSLGVTFLPQKYWAVALPIYLGVAFFLFVFVFYPSLGLCITPPLDDVRNVTDEFARYYDFKERMGDLVNSGRIPQVGDLSPKQLLDTVYAKGQD